MFPFFLPIGHDETEMRRVPRATLAILLVNVIVFIFTYVISGSAGDRAHEALRDAIQYLSEHPHLDLEPSLAAKLEPELRDNVTQGLAQLRGEVPRPTSDELAASRERLRYLCDRASRLLSQIDQRYEKRLGFIPADAKPTRILSSMFVHGGWEHLLGNLFIFYLTAPFVESALGTPLFSLLYLTGGVTAALAQRASDPASTIPMVGASGAIFAVLGAFLVRFYAARFKLFYFVWLIRVFMGTIWVRAYVMVPIVVILELIHAAASRGMSGVAHWAHVGGFAGGAAIALAARLLHFEPSETHVARSAARGRPALERAKQLRVSGRLVEARGLLEKERLRPPGPAVGDDLDVRRELVLTLAALGDAQAHNEARALVTDLARGTNLVLARRVVKSFLEGMPDLRLPAPAVLTLARDADRRQATTEALELLERVAGGRPFGPGTAKALAFIADIHFRHGAPAKAIAALASALTIPSLDAAVRAELTEKLKDIAASAELPLPELPRIAPPGAAPPPIAKP